jgi:hypothetical protein
LRSGGALQGAPPLAFNARGSSANLRRNSRQQAPLPDFSADAVANPHSPYRARLSCARLETQETPMSSMSNNDGGGDSVRRAERNRANAEKSTGPRTPDGKRRSSQNAIKHGLYAKSPIIRGEDADALAQLRHAFADDLCPFGATEWEAVEDAADAAWRKRRYRRIEAEIFERAFAEADGYAAVGAADNHGGSDPDRIAGGPPAPEVDGGLGSSNPSPQPSHFGGGATFPP